MWARYPPPAHTDYVSYFCDVAQLIERLSVKQEDKGLTPFVAVLVKVMCTLGGY